MIDREQLAAAGHASSSLLDRGSVDDLARAFVELGLAPVPAFFASANDLDRAGAAAAHHAILSVAGPALADLFPDLRPFLASFLVKGPGDGARISFHQDLTYTDERHHRAVVTWIPLIDVDEGNGALALVRGSHRWTTGSRPGGPRPLPTDALQDEFAACAELVPLRAGDVVAYDAATVHGSPPNVSSAARVAVGIALVPRRAQLVHVHLDDDGLSAHDVDADYYLDQGLRHRPVGYPARPPWALPVTPIQFEQRR